jgi:Do/DeqQ family serine protease
MRLSRLVVFLAQMITLGLAIAFILTVFWPGLIQRGQPTIEIHESSPSTGNARSRGPVSYADAVEKAAPAVVNINTAKVVTVRRNPFFDDPVFRQFFGITPDGGSGKRVETSLGSGVIFSEQGYILTNHHVISGADAIQVFLRDGRSAPARLIGSDPETDVAVLKIDLPKLPVITLGQSDKSHIGDVVLAIGNPFGVGQTVTMGIVSATGRSKLGINTFENFIQTDAAINPGNSGGALVDASGDLIGINTAIFSQSGGSVGIGFAIPISLAKDVMEQIIQHGRPQRGWLGIEGQPLTPELGAALKIPPDTKGVVVTGLLRGGPADRAGLQPGDVIVSINNDLLKDARQALGLIAQRKPGEKIRLQIVRAGKPMTLEAQVIERPAQTLRSE